MVGRTLHYVSLVCCSFVIVSFGLFALAEVSHASTHQANEIEPAAQRAAQEAANAAGPLTLHFTTPQPVKAVPHQTGQPKRFIDDVASKLESPFSSIVASDDAWVNHVVPTLFALLVFGGGLGYLARFANGRAGAQPA
jgi:hypothetical protein